MIWNTKISTDIINEISQNTMVSHLGIKITKIGDNFIKATMPVDSRTVQPMRILHGGASVALAETLGSVASIASVDPDKFNVVGIEINANHLKSVSSGMVTACVKPIRIGRKIHVWNIEIKDDSDDLVCVSRLTVMVIPKK